LPFAYFCLESTPKHGEIEKVCSQFGAIWESKLHVE